MLWRLFLASLFLTGLGQSSFLCPSDQRSIVAIYACAFTCGRSFTVCSGWGVLSFWSFLVFSPTLLPLYFITMFFTIVYIIVYYCYYSTELPALCDECLGWGWVWRAGLVAGLRVGQAFGMFMLQLQPLGSWAPNLHVRLRR